jgi:hypothetical protein
MTPTKNNKQYKTTVKLKPLEAREQKFMFGKNNVPNVSCLFLRPRCWNMHIIDRLG